MGSEISKLFITIGAKTDEFTKGIDGVNKKLMGVGAAMGAVGVAGLKMVDSARKVNAQLQSTGLILGETTGEMREMVLELADVTFGIDSVTQTFDLLAKAGIRGQEEIKATAVAFDALADATGSSAEVVASQMIPAMKTFGLSAGETRDKIDSMTYMTKNSTLTLEDFNSMVGYITPAIVEQGLTIEDLTSALILMERDGYAPGRVMTREFMKATTAAMNEQISLTEALGYSADEIGSVKEELEGATGITKQHAAAMNEQYGIMDKLRFMWSKIQLVLGSVLTPLEPVFAVMTAMTPVMMFLSTQVGRNAIAWLAKAGAVMKSHVASAMHVGSTAALTGATGAQTGALIGATGAQKGLNAAMMANPIIAITAAVAGLVTVLVMMWRNWETVSFQMEAGWLEMRRIFGLGLDTYQAEKDLLMLEGSWIAVRKKVEEHYDTLVAEVKTATDVAITDAQRVADEEKRILSERAKFYSEKHYERMELIDEEMMAEIRAIDPVLAAELEGINTKIKGINDAAKEREREAEQDRIRALEKELRDKETSQERKKAIERELDEVEEAGRKEALLAERNQMIAEANLEEHFENQKSLIDQQLEGQIAVYKAELEMNY